MAHHDHHVVLHSINNRGECYSIFAFSGDNLAFYFAKDGKLIKFVSTPTTQLNEKDTCLR